LYSAWYDLLGSVEPELGHGITVPSVTFVDCGAQFVELKVVMPNDANVSPTREMPLLSLPALPTASMPRANGCSVTVKSRRRLVIHTRLGSMNGYTTTRATLTGAANTHRS